ncbi:MAG TPA: hypothetical protein VG935_04545, partial [Patescibacteria group bacterium]|nr:hypothetical protein [Patescibacteria group bacterium]
MTHLKAKIVASAATVALLATSFAPATFASTHIKVKKNGAGSKNTVTTKNTSKTTVDQSNA